MDHFAGLDVSVKETSVCILDDAGKILKEVKVASEPQALLKVLRSPTYRFKRIGLEAGPLSQWLFSALAEAELPVICVETRHMQAVLKAQINKYRWSQPDEGGRYWEPFQGLRKGPIKDFVIKFRSTADDLGFAMANVPHFTPRVKRRPFLLRSISVS
jgi:hypothetical protein